MNATTSQYQRTTNGMNNKGHNKESGPTDPNDIKLQNLAADGPTADILSNLIYDTETFF